MKNLFRVARNRHIARGGLRLVVALATAFAAATGSCGAPPPSPSPASCTYTISPTTQSVDASGGTGTVTVTGSPSGCAGSWTATSSASFVTITSGSSGSGPGTFTVAYLVSSNTGDSRNGTLIIAGQTFTLAQAAAGASSFTPGTNTLVASQTIGPNGGTITVANSGTALDGARITFPIGALPSNKQVSVSFNSGRMVPNAGVFPGSALVLDISGVTSFDQAISVTVPYTGGNNFVPVPYVVESDGTLRSVQIVSIDRRNGTFTFQTWRGSWFTWIWSQLSPDDDVVAVATGLPASDVRAVATGFLPANDGFQVVNRGSTYNREGECVGMTAFSLWYFNWYKKVNGNFYPRFMNNVGNDSAGAPIVCQNVIATRAFTSITQHWTAYWPAVARQQSLTRAEQYASIKNIMSNTRSPVLLYLYHTNGSGDAHSVLAYSVDDSLRQISVYDPNLPGTAQHVNFSGASQYCNDTCYDGIVYRGDGGLALTESYGDILIDAQFLCSNSGGATITVTSHTNGQAVSSLLQELRGFVESGQLLVTRLTAIVGSVEYSVDLADMTANIPFRIPVNLTSGTNHIKFRTEGKNARGALVPTPNNFDAMDFTIEAGVTTSVILATLTWNTPDTDLDLYVIDPTGDFSSYYHKTTTDGGVLDQDVTTGFGPEHWTLLTSNIIRYNAPYRFRVHYYTDNQRGPSIYHLTILVYDGTRRRVMYTYVGGLAANDKSNNQPNGTGADWADVTTFTVTQTPTGTAFKVQPAVPGEAEDIAITVPLSSLDRVKH